MEKYSKQKKIVSLMEKMMHNTLFCGFVWTFMLCSCGQSQQEDSPQAIYETSIVKPESRTLESFYPTTIQGRQDVNVFAQITGKIVKVCVTEGQKVKKGQTLFVIDPVPFPDGLQHGKGERERSPCPTRHSQNELSGQSETV